MKTQAKLDLAASEGEDLTTYHNFSRLSVIRPKARQMWACNVCEFERQWGNGYPDHAQPKTPKLYCASCKLLTPHYFIGLMDEWESA